MKLEYTFMMRLIGTPFTLDFITINDTPVVPLNMLVTDIFFLEIDYLIGYCSFNLKFTILIFSFTWNFIVFEL